MLDQVEKLKKAGINAAAIYAEQEESVLEDIETDVVFNVIFTSPESMLGTNPWRKFITSEMFSRYRVGVVFDEAHCIAHWYVLCTYL